MLRWEIVAEFDGNSGAGTVSKGDDFGHLNLE